MPHKRKIDIPKALKLRNKGCTLQDIADQQGVSRVAVYKALKPLQVELPNESDQDRVRRQITPLMEYNLHKTVALMVNSDDPKERRDHAVTVGILNQNVRLNTGQSTSNSSVMLKHIQAACQSSESDDDAFSRDL